MGSIAYWFLGNAEVQQWSKFDAEDSNVNVDTVTSNESCDVDASGHKSVQ